MRRGVGDPLDPPDLRACLGALGENSKYTHLNAKKFKKWPAHKRMSKILTFQPQFLNILKHFNQRESNNHILNVISSLRYRQISILVEKRELSV